MNTENNHENFDAGQQLHQLAARLRLMSVRPPAVAMLEQSTLKMIPVSDRTYVALTRAVATYQKQQNGERHG